MKKEEDAWIDHPVSDIGIFDNELDLTRETRSSSDKEIRFSSGRQSKIPPQIKWIDPKDFTKSAVEKPARKLHQRAWFHYPG